MTALIDIEKVTKSGDVFTVSYWDENCNGENNTTIQIKEDSLVEFVDEFYSNNDEDFYNISAKDYFYENRDFVIKDYITANS